MMSQSQLITNQTLARNHKLADTYQLRRTLSVGELSVIYVARHMEKGTLHVIKEFFPAALARRSKDRCTVECIAANLQDKFAEMRQKFRQEGELLRRMEHPGIVRYEDELEHHGTVYIVLEYYRGMTLDVYIQQYAPSLDTEFLQKRLFPVIDALEYIHNLGYIHRDVKPSNILLAEDGQTKLLDFGSAVRYEEKTHQILTTAGYSPIEFYSGRSIQGPVSDIYSLAATFYFCCRGQAPIDVPKRIFHDPLERLGSCQPASPILSRVIHWGLAVSANKRCASLKWFKIAVQAERFWRRNLVLTRSKRSEAVHGKGSIVTSGHRQKNRKQKALVSSKEPDQSATELREKLPR
ncbi:serine/threonine-protein kinase [Paenibacillus campi]|uniref:serine/threonine protein kinase n=1 Tax=Paenibacillus campi TaxID=3106031 RepID=UPI002AFE8DC4|nr:serine/threonine-protein kinase [Paenibacillus sp. SGZ-1014]